MVGGCGAVAGAATMTPPTDTPRLSRRAAARLGGLATVADRGSRWMAELGRRGGLTVSANREWMRFIGARGGRRARQREQSG